MQDYQQAFLEFSIAEGALKFGHFKLKSGRESPYFFNAGHFNHGASLAQLGRYYAAAIIDSGIACDLIYGPAYKGIPLAAATAIALADHHGRDLPYAFNRKEAKDHGEGGLIVGSPLVGDVLIIDDVITAGTSVRESLAIIEAAGARPAGVMIALDRQELGQGGRSAVDEVRLELGLPVASIVTMNDMITFLEQRGDNADVLASMHAYRERWGAT